MNIDLENIHARQEPFASYEVRIVDDLSSMAILFGTPSHAVVDPEPRFGKVSQSHVFLSASAPEKFFQVLRFFRFRDYATVVTATAFSVPVGYIFGAMCRAAVLSTIIFVNVFLFSHIPPSASGHPIRGPASLCAGALGLTAGFIAAYQNSSARLLGYAENAKEVEAEEKFHKKARASTVAKNPANKE